MSRRTCTRQIAFIAIAVIALLLPRIGRRGELAGTKKATPAALATLCPARVRRRPPTQPARLPILDANSDGRAAMEALRQITRVVRVNGHDTRRRVGISPAQLEVLRVLGEGQSLSLSEVAARTMTNLSSVSEVVTRLVNQGMVLRARGEADGRRVELSLSEAGKLAVSVAPAIDDHVLRGLDRMQPEERRELTRLLGRLLDQITPSDEPDHLSDQDAA